VSRQSDAKKARRNKRRATREARWLPEAVLGEVADEVELAEFLEYFDELVSQRGWIFDDETSTEDNVAWFYEPSVDGADDHEGPLTTIWMSAEDNAEWVSLLLIGTKEGYQFEPEAFLEHLETIEAYRLGDPAPTFDLS
jgi:hypothetical protein